ncbi:MAG: DNA glycosylase [Oscillospiraceae bacterium]
MPSCTKSGIILASTDELSISKTLDCGQCFRWSRDENGAYTGVAGGRVLRLWEENDSVFCDAPENDLPFWRDYFDLDTDYISAGAKFTQSDYLKTCAEFGSGIHILRQDFWEALCSFIVSQCNNIPRIKKIISTLCGHFGENLGEGFYSFPEASKIAALDESDLAPLRCGYRAAYILNAARAVSEGSLCPSMFAELSPEEALNELKKIHGIGNKVASCVLLFGLHRMDAFPIDVWMKRALKEHFPRDFDPKVLGEFAGLAQQYIFFYARSSDGK